MRNRIFTEFQSISVIACIVSLQNPYVEALTPSTLACDCFKGDPKVQQGHMGGALIP